MRAYFALFEPDLDARGYVVALSDFGFGLTQGETEEEATEMVRGLLMLRATTSVNRDPCHAMTA